MTDTNDNMNDAVHSEPTNVRFDLQDRVAEAGEEMMAGRDNQPEANALIDDIPDHGPANVPVVRPLPIHRENPSIEFSQTLDCRLFRILVLGDKEQFEAEVERLDPKVLWTIGQHIDSRPRPMHRNYNCPLLALVFDIRPHVSSMRCVIERSNLYVDQCRLASINPVPKPLTEIVNVDGSTILHQLCCHITQSVALNFRLRRQLFDVMKYVIEQYPQAVLRESDPLLLRPIDYFSSLVFGSEESMKYNGCSKAYDLSWEHIYVLASVAEKVANYYKVHHRGPANWTDIRMNIPVDEESALTRLHTFLRCPRFPIALFHRALKRYSSDLAKVTNDIDKDRLLHAAVRCCRPRSDDDVDVNENDGRWHEKEADRNSELFPLLLKADPEAASIVNAYGKIPLQLAVEQGNSWDDEVVQLLVSAFPAGIHMLDLPPNIIPVVVQRLATKNLSAVFGFLRSAPIQEWTEISNT